MIRTVGVFLLLVCGCVRVNVGSPGQTMVYLMDPPPVAPVATRVGGSVQVNEFTAPPPYDTPDMVIVTAAGTVVAATKNRWASRPAGACTEILWRDLIASGAVETVHRRSGRGGVISVDGHVHECGAREVQDQWHAVLDVTVTLSATDGGTAVLQRHRRFSAPMDEGFASLAEAMAPLMRAWADSVIGDIRRSMAPPAELPRLHP